PPGRDRAAILRRAIRCEAAYPPAAPRQRAARREGHLPRSRGTYVGPLEGPPAGRIGLRDAGGQRVELTPTGLACLPLRPPTPVPGCLRLARVASPGLGSEGRPRPHLESPPSA